ncbi:MAG TPA: hypothetical protein VN824_15975, partial [Puia sp.]|nr:hypothetical protein [Puia sp.]
DLTRRRGLIRSVDMVPGQQRIQASVPLSELFGYITTLRTITAGRASASLTFEEYQPVPDQAGRKSVVA